MNRVRVDNAMDQRKPSILIGMLPIWLVTTLPTWLLIFIVLYALAALYIAIRFREVRKFFAEPSLSAREYLGICGSQTLQFPL